MNYIECYNRLVESRQILGRSKGTGVYYEKHHIVPRWLNGKDTKDNLVLFTAKEHYIAHLLLWKHYRDRPSALAFHKMTKSTNKNQQRKFTSMQFEKARLAFVQTQLGDLNWARNNESPLKGKPNVNKGKKLVILSEPEWIKDENEKITITLYNEKLEKIWSSEQTYAYPWTRAVYNEPFVNNDGTVFILKKTDMKGEGNTYSIFSFNGKSLKEFKVQLDGNKKAVTLAKAISPEGNFTIAGYYTEDAKVKIGFGTAYHGSFISSIDKSGESAKIMAVNPFEKRKDIVAKSIIFHDNKFILMGEEFIVNSKSAEKDPKVPLAEQDMFARDYSYNAMRIFADGFDAAGKTLYNTSIKKDNSSKNDFNRWNSYFSSVMKGKLYVIFNDEKYRYDEKKKAIVFGGSPRIAVYATIDPNT
jgi:hypothetical protein